MANRFPLVLNQANLQIQELASGDNLNLLNNDIINVGNIIPQGNLTYDLGNTTNYWNNLYLSGNTIFLGNLQLKEVNSTTFGVFESDGVTQADLDVGNIDVSAITQGTSVIGIDGVNGNAYVTVAGTANVVLAQSSGVAITGTLSATGNVTGGNLITAGIVTASGNIEGNYFIGNGSQLDGIDTTLISNGTSEVKVISSGGNIRSNVAGSTVMLTSSNGIEITGTLDATANITGSNLVTSGDVTTATVTASGNVSGGNITTAGLVSAGTTITATGNVSGGNITTAGVVTATGNVQGGNITTAGVVTASGNISGANLNATGNITSNNLLVNTDAVITGNLTVQGTETIFNVETLTVNDKDIVVANNVTGGANVNGAGLLAGNPTVASFVYNNATSSWQVNVAVTPDANGTLALGGTDNRWGDAWVTSLTATGNLDSGNITTVGAVDATGNVTGGNITTAGDVTTATVTASGTIDAVGNITGGNLVTAGDVTTATVTASGTIDAVGNIDGGNLVTAGVVDATGNVTGGNLVTAGDVTTATVTASGNIDGGNITTAGVVEATGNVTGGNLVTAGDVTTATVTASSTIDATGNITGGNLVTAGDVTTATVTASGNIDGGNLVTGGVVDATGNVSGGNLTTAGAVDATGNVSGGNLITSGEIIATGNITVGNLITTGSVLAGSITGVTTIDATGNIVGGNLRSNDSIFAIGNITTANYYFGNGAFLDGIDTTLISNGTTSVRVVSSGGNITANVADQTVQLWHLGGVTITGNIDTSGQGRVRFFDSDSSHYVGFQAPAAVASDLDFVLPDGYGNSGEFLTTDGQGELSWSSASGFFNSTLLIFPGAQGNIDYGAGEAYVGADASVDAFGVTIFPNYSCMDPSGSFAPTTDLGGLT